MNKVITQEDVMAYLKYLVDTLMVADVPAAGARIAEVGAVRALVDMYGAEDFELANEDDDACCGGD